MITASHNPPADNGYKLYLSDGAQIVPPADLEIEGAIRSLGPLSAVPVAEPRDGLITEHGDEIAFRYAAAICANSPAPRGAAWLRYIYTPLHGVACDLALRAFDQAGYPPPDVVEAQARPDPDFRTVAFPNPEEPGSLDLALAQARRCGADLVLANDPDGDRLAVAVPDDGAPGGWRMLTGDQVGSLLGAYQLSLQVPVATGAHAAQVAFSESLAAGGPATPDDLQPLVATTIVSATMLAKIASAAGAGYAETLTGFKPGPATCALRTASSSATKKRSATRSARRSGTRTESVRRSPCSAWPPALGQVASRCSRHTTRSRARTAYT
jgi:phosphomannomutase